MQLRVAALLLLLWLAASAALPISPADHIRQEDAARGRPGSGASRSSSSSSPVSGVAAGGGTSAGGADEERWSAHVAASAAVPAAIDCPLKRFAAQFAAYVQPEAWPHASNWTEEAVSAMSLPSLCGINAQSVPAPPFRRPSTLPASATAPFACDWTRYVDVAKGDNSNDGSLAHPWGHMAFAVPQSRTRQNPLQRACIFLRGGYYPFGDHHEQRGRASESQLGALALTATDSNLTIAAYNHEEVVFSAGVILTGLQWSVYRETPAGRIMQAHIPRTPSTWTGRTSTSCTSTTPAPFAPSSPTETPSSPARLTHPTGYSSGAASWIGPDPSIGVGTEVLVADPVPASRFFPRFQIGLQGTVRDFDPPHSFWGLAKPPGGGGATYVKPRGFVWSASGFSPRAANWSNPTTGRVFTFHGRGWGSWQFGIASVHAHNSTLLFGAGGFQEARGATTGGLMYVHNILEELDDVNEWFVDPASRTLYFMSNDTMPSRFIASQVPCIVSLHGTSQSPVSSVTLSGLTFSHTPNTFMRPYEAPSGGDYSIHRGAALFLQGTQSVLVVNCTFTQLGSNALFVSNYNANATIAHNQFQWLGESAVLLAGSSDGVDGVSNRQQPMYTHVEGNLMRDFSVYVKQGDAIFEALTRSSVWAGNMAYNSPRSLFNKNDGFAGGLEVYQNLLFNANKETSDHGPINVRPCTNHPRLHWHAHRTSPLCLLPSPPVLLTVRCVLLVRSDVGPAAVPDRRGRCGRVLRASDQPHPPQLPRQRLRLGLHRGPRRRLRVLRGRLQRQPVQRHQELPRPHQEQPPPAVRVPRRLPRAAL